MIFHVVDTNVAIVANVQSPQAGPECVVACVDVLQYIYDAGVVVIDDGMRIIREYMDNLSLSGQPGPGDAFMKWVWHNQANDDRCERVHLTEDGSREFEEFPDDPRLECFDKSDRKFVAVALTSRNHPEILNAVDSDWWDYREAFAGCGIKVKFLCPSQFTNHKE